MSRLESPQEFQCTDPQPTKSKDHIFEIDRNELAVLERRQEAGFFPADSQTASSNLNKHKPEIADPGSTATRPVMPRKDSPHNRSSENDREKHSNDNIPTNDPHNSQNEISFCEMNDYSQASKQGSSNKIDTQTWNKPQQQTFKKDTCRDTKLSEDTGYSRREPPKHLADKNNYDYKPNEAYPLFDQQHQRLNLDSLTSQHHQADGAHHNKHHEHIKHFPSHSKHQKIDYFHDDGTHDGEPDTKDHPRFKKEFLNQPHEYQPDPHLEISGNLNKIELVRPEHSRKQPEKEASDDTMKQLEIFKQLVAENIHNTTKNDRNRQPQSNPSFDRNQQQPQVSTTEKPKPHNSNLKRIEEDMDYLLHIPKEVDVANSTVFQQKRNIVYVRVDQDEAERKRLKELERKKQEIKFEKEQEELRKKKEREELFIKQQAEEKRRYEMKMKKWEDED